MKVIVAWWSASALSYPGGWTPPKAASPREEQARRVLGEALDRCWSDLDGETICEAEKDIVRETSGRVGFVYGECLYDGARAIFEALGLYDAAGSVFADLGSGVGKLTAQAYCETPVDVALGVELSRERHDKAVEGWRRLRDDAKPIRERHGDAAFDAANITFVCDDIFRVDLDAVTHCYVSNLLFSKDANRRLSGLLGSMPNLRRVATLTRLDDAPPHFAVAKTWAMMSWSRDSASPIYVYYNEHLNEHPLIMVALDERIKRPSLRILPRRPASLLETRVDDE